MLLVLIVLSALSLAAFIAALTVPQRWETPLVYVSGLAGVALFVAIITVWSFGGTVTY
jgi:hypothetical protein